MTIDSANEIALKILRLFQQDSEKGWDLHTFLELIAGDDQARRRKVFDITEDLVSSGLLESRGSDFFTITGKGIEAANRGRIEHQIQLPKDKG